MHRTHGDSRFTWHHNVTATDLAEMTVTEISNITEATLHVCASHHIDPKDTREAPLQRWHYLVQNTCRAHVHRMHTQNATKMTNHQVLLNASRQHHITLL